jgi:hypothetical protein
MTGVTPRRDSVVTHFSAHTEALTMRKGLQVTAWVAAHAIYEAREGKTQRIVSRILRCLRSRVVTKPVEGVDHASPAAMTLEEHSESALECVLYD